MARKFWRSASQIASGAAPLQVSFKNGFPGVLMVGAFEKGFDQTFDPVKLWLAGGISLSVSGGTLMQRKVPGSTDGFSTLGSQPVPKPSAQSPPELN